MGLHKNLTSTELHVLHAFTYTNATAREAATGFVAGDIGKVALQSDNLSFWILTSTTPTWSELTKTAATSVAGRIVVGKSGAVDFTNIKDAVAQAVTNGASLTNPYIVLVYPGIYTENNPITVPQGVIVSTITGERNASTLVKPSNPLDDLFIVNNSALTGLALSGVTDPLKACIRTSQAGKIANIHACSFTNCSNGMIIESSSIGILTTCVGSVIAASSAIETGVLVDGYGSRLIMSESLFNVPAAILPSYVGNPLNTAVYAKNGCLIDILNSTFQITANNSNQNSILIADPDTTVRVVGCNFDNGSNAIHIASSGTDAVCSIVGTTIFNYTLNFNIESSTGTIFQQITTDSFKQSVVAGGAVNGISGELADNSSNAIGLFHYVYSINRQVPLSKFIFDRTSSGLSTDSGSVTKVSGLTVNVSDGYGWVRRLVEQDVDDITWSSTNLTLTANAANYIYYDATLNIITSNTSGVSVDDIQLATVYTDSIDVRFIHNTSSISVNTDYLFHRYLLATRKFALNSGLAASLGSSNFKFSISAGSYYITTTLINFDGYTDANFSYFYNGGATEIHSSVIDATRYDNAGTLTTMSDGYYRADSVYLTSDGRVSLIYGTSQFDTVAGATALTPLPAPTFIEPSGVTICNIIVQKTTGINSFVDYRPRPAATSSGGTSAGITDHGLLAGLLDDDHPQYILADGTRSLAGNLNLGGHSIANVNLVDGVDVSSHGSRHNPGQIDAISTAAPVAVLVGATASEGIEASVARSDHQHGVAAGTPVTISTANSAGTASTVARSDHVHAHGSLAGGSTHALVIADPAGTAGYMSSADKQKLDGIASGATNTTLSNTIPVSVNKSVSLAGTATEASRQDHKHNIDTAAPATIGIANSEGTATSLARSDHVHRGPVLQTVFAEISTDITTTSATFVTLISQSVTTTGGNLIIHFTASPSNTNANTNVTFRVSVDSVSKRATQTRILSANIASSATIVTKVTGLSAAAHTVLIEWKVSANTGQIRPVAAVDIEHASLLITEVIV